MRFHLLMLGILVPTLSMADCKVSRFSAKDDDIYVCGRCGTKTDLATCEKNAESRFKTKKKACAAFNRTPMNSERSVGLAQLPPRSFGSRLVCIHPGPGYSHPGNSANTGN